MLAHAALVFVAWLAGMPPAAGGASGIRPDEAVLLNLVNDERASRGLRRLEWDATLAQLARAHAADMRSMGRATHESSRDGGVFTDRLARTDLRVTVAAENVARDRDVRSAHRGLMRSPGHRANILRDGLDAVGIGVVSDEQRNVYVVEDFAARIATLTDEQAARAIRESIRTDPSGCCGHGFAEIDTMSDRVAVVLERLVASDSVELDGVGVGGPSWIYAYTTADPATLPREMTRRLPHAVGYGVAVSFRKTRSYPFGIYWVVVALAQGS